jgi:hypothetical protein
MKPFLVWSHVGCFRYTGFVRPWSKNNLDASECEHLSVTEAVTANVGTEGAVRNFPKAPTFCFPSMDPDTTVENIVKPFTSKTVYTGYFLGTSEPGCVGFFRSWFCPIMVCFIVQVSFG